MIQSVFLIAVQELREVPSGLATTAFPFGTGFSHHFSRDCQKRSGTG